jgi:hypothetical protein
MNPGDNDTFQTLLPPAVRKKKVKNQQSTKIIKTAKNNEKSVLKLIRRKHSRRGDLKKTTCYFTLYRVEDLKQTGDDIDLLIIWVA